ncbi:hypothetical protein [Streptomyces olivochromogenes]|uniref:hypothetical protein n=1 Tax=Streptomyces olivochromogenes TaxID=1963 RepID=UPI001F1AE50B|nr:hypothetical protein [Streptomyces olivochromogenes]MCF3133658.1 hypothetical protein [Streptomyces olivochromogenes]
MRFGKGVLYQYAGGLKGVMAGAGTVEGGRQGGGALKEDGQLTAQLFRVCGACARGDAGELPGDAALVVVDQFLHVGHVPRGFDGSEEPAAAAE